MEVMDHAFFMLWVLSTNEIIIFFLFQQERKEEI